MWPYTISYIFIRGGNFILKPSLVTSYAVGTYSLQTFPVLRCNATMAMQADYTCGMNCLTSKCLFCQTVNSDFFNVCRYCNGISSSCQPITGCPIGYYLEYGICYQCPIGTTACTRGDLATTCQAGLVLTQNIQTLTLLNALNIPYQAQVVMNASCACPIGQFGTNNYTTNTVACGKYSLLHSHA